VGQRQLLETTDFFGSHMDEHGVAVATMALELLGHRVS
jgi:hypothetical protein